VSERIVLHADMDAFYASIEERDRPELRGKPIIVGAMSARGVVAAASYAARKFGVRSAMPGFRARELCPEGVFLPSDMKKYVRVSEQVHRIFEEFTPVIEPLALDEAFLDISGSVHLHGNARALAQRLKDRVKAETQLIVSCGVAPNKLVAKIACSLGKPDGLVCVEAAEIRGLLDPLPLRRLLGVGPVAERELRAAGFETLGDLANAELDALYAKLGERAAALRQLARGEDDRPVVADREPKSYGEENTFEQDERDGPAITQALTSHAHAVARRLRRDGIVGRTVTLKMRLAKRRGTSPNRTPDSHEGPRYPLLTRARSLSEPTDDAATIRRVAIELWDAARLGVPIRLVGVAVSNLSHAGLQQLGLFDANSARSDARSAKLGPALDAIRARFGEQAIHVATKDPEKLTPSLRKKRGE
jgi:DNA polymerase-4